MLTKEQAIEILDKLDFFQGQRAGRELWSEKPFNMQEQDIEDFKRNVALLKEYINAADVAPKGEVAKKIIQDIAEVCTPNEAYFVGVDFEIGYYTAMNKVLAHLLELKQKHTEGEK